MKSSKPEVRSRRPIWIATAFVVAILAGFSFDMFVPQAGAQEVRGSVSGGLTTDDNDAVMWAYQSAFRSAAQEALPVVVKIDVVDVREVQTPTFQFWFFRQPQEDQTQPETQEQRTRGLGSGVIVRRAGEKIYVLTNDHVVGEAEEITVTLHDGSEYSATLVGTDTRRDLALVVFETTIDVPVAVLGDSSAVEVGDWAFAVGNPLGFESTVTAGIVSAVGRRPSATSNINQLTDYIQTDAAINQGNSGGALVNLAGEVIGINTWIASQSGGNIGLGFAIPINNAKRAIDEFISYGEVEYGWLGIQSGGTLSAEVAESLGLGDDRGAFVGSVFIGSPAEDGGLKPGDIIREINGRAVDSWDDLINVVADLAPGSQTSFRVWRSGRTINTRVEIGRRDTEAESAESWPGISVQPLTDDLKRSLGLRNESGNLAISTVAGNSAASEAGLRRLDIVREVNGEEVKTLREFYRIVTEQADDDLVFRIGRQGREVVIGIVR